MYDRIINDLKEENTNNKKINLGLDPELDLRNVNFATGENLYLSKNVPPNEDEIGR